MSACPTPVTLEAHTAASSSPTTIAASVALDTQANTVTLYLMAVKADLVVTEGPVLLPVTCHMVLSANVLLGLLVLHVNMTPRPVEVFIATMEAPVSLATKVQNVCALHYSPGPSAESPLTVHAIQTHATMVVHVKAPLRLRTTTVSALPTLLVKGATSWIEVCRKSVKYQNAKILNTTRFVMCFVTTMHVAGTMAIAHSTLMIRGKTAPPHCSAGATLIMESVIHSVTTLDASLMALIARTWRDNAILCTTSTAKITMQMATVIKAATTQSVNGTAWTVPICLRSSRWASW